MKAIIIILIFALIASIISTLFSLVDKDPLGWDYNHSHKRFIASYINGDFSPLKEYLPLFHFLMLVPTLLVNDMRIYQVILSTLSMASILFMVYSLFDLKTVVITGIFLLFSSGYVLYSMLLTPTVLDFIIFSLVVVAYFKKKYLLTSIGLLFLVYSHTLGIFYLITIGLYSLLANKEYLNYFFIVLILSIPSLLAYTVPVILYIFSGFNGAFYMYMGMVEADIKAVYPITKLFVFMGTVMLSMIPITILAMFKLKKFDKKQGFLVCWLVTFAPLFYFIFYRWASLSVIPLAIFEAVAISKFLDRFK